MRANDIPAGVAALARCRAILGGTHDAFRPLWDGFSDRRRCVLLGLAGRRGLYSGRRWCDLPGDVRADVRRAVCELRDVLNDLPAGV